ncbi:MAG: helix-turn-helix domain-containing protein [Nostoc sp. EkiNYC01]|nr:helix-turn-helix domain-containing protein [Nostoc sp. EkiNYC01]
MIDPSTINLLTLPSLPLEQRSQLPTTPCIYFAIDSEGVVQYIGKAKNLKKRWELHHKGIDLALLGGVKISYLCIELSLLEEVENALLHWFNPPLNRITNLVDKKERSGVFRVKRVLRVDAPGIGAKIKDARERDPRSVDELAKAAGMTRANWYRIEREENDVLPEPTLRKIEEVLGVDFGVKFDD